MGGKLALDNDPNQPLAVATGVLSLSSHLLFFFLNIIFNLMEKKKMKWNFSRKQKLPTVITTSSALKKLTLEEKSVRASERIETPIYCVFKVAVFVVVFGNIVDLNLVFLKRKTLTQWPSIGLYMAKREAGCDPPSEHSRTRKSSSLKIEKKKL